MTATVYGAVRANALTATGTFAKSNSNQVAFAKSGAFSLQTAVDLALEVNGAALTVASGTALVMPETPVTGTDYAIWVQADGVIQATADHVNPPATGARKVGGFHYAPGGNAAAQAGGDSTPSINPYSLWDLHWRPACPDPRGMALVADGFWADIYLTGVDAITNGSSKYNVTIADGSSPPKVPSRFGGNGSATYGSYTWFEAMELSCSLGKRCPTQQEFMAATHGVTEGTSRGTDPVTTGLDAARTSRWGLMQATGGLWIWGCERGGPTSTSSNTDGRGTETDAPNAALLGGNWNHTSYSGSRCSAWFSAAAASYGYISSRFVCDHLAPV